MTVQWIGIKKTTFDTQWVVIYPVDSVVQIFKKIGRQT